ncbi:NAD(P)-dependent oxidoreductase [Bacteroidota bacterium]
MSKTTNVFFAFQPEENLKRHLLKELESYNNVKLIFPVDSSDELILKYASDAEIIVGWRPTDELIRAAKNLRLFINPGTGVQHLIEKFRKLKQERDIVLINGHGNSYFCAQHAVAMLLALMNKVIPHHNWLSEGKWRTGDQEAMSIPLRNRKIGFCGYGAINQKVHRFLSGFDVEFSIFRKNWEKKELLFPTPVKKYSSQELNSFIKEIDTIIIALPSTSVTRGLFGKKEFELLGSEGLVVNVGRGDVIIEEGLYNSLKNNTICGAAIDVWFNYKPGADAERRKYPFNFPFQKLDNIVLSPHRAASPFDDLKRWDEVIENIKRFSRGEDNFINVVDLDKEY